MGQYNNLLRFSNIVMTPSINPLIQAIFAMNTSKFVLCIPISLSSFSVLISSFLKRHQILKNKWISQVITKQSSDLCFTFLFPSQPWYFYLGKVCVRKTVSGLRTELCLWVKNKIRLCTLCVLEDNKLSICWPCFQWNQWAW